jgi:K+-sensing histidine kinase KdpD
MRDSAPRVLIVGPESEQRTQVADALATAGCVVAQSSSIEERPQSSGVQIDAIVADLQSIEIEKLASALCGSMPPKKGSDTPAEAKACRTPESLRKLAHDLRTPLNAILGWTQLLKFGDLDDRMKQEALDTIERSAKAQAEMISNMLDLPPA